MTNRQPATRNDPPEDPPEDPRDPRQLRVLHAADLHIDSPMHGLTAYEGAPVDQLRAATRRAMENLVGAAVAQEVQLVVLAGDLYDGDWRDYNTGLFVVARLAELHEAGIPVVLVYGNHDAASHLTKHLRLPPTTTALGAAGPQTVVLDQLGLAVHGQSYPSRAVTADLAEHYPAADRSLVNIGLLHTCFDGAPGHERYAPCTMDGLRSKGYDYWALGHVHQRRVVGTDPLTVFPGNLQGRHARETGEKGATLVTFTDGVASQRPLALDVVRWEHLVVDVDGAGSVDECLDRCAAAFEHLGDAGGVAPVDAGAPVDVPAPVDTYAVRITLRGRTAASQRLRADQPGLHGEIRAMALGRGGPEVWVEKVLAETTAPSRRAPLRPAPSPASRAPASPDPAAPDPAADAPPDRQGPLAEIAGVVSELRADLRADSELLFQRDHPAARVLATLRRELRAATASDETLDADQLDRLVVDAADLLGARLVPGEVGDAD